MTRKIGRIMNEENMFAVLRLATVAAGAVGTLLALWLGAIGVSMLDFLCEDGVCVRDAAVCLLCLAVLAGISACCYAAGRCTGSQRCSMPARACCSSRSWRFSS